MWSNVDSKLYKVANFPNSEGEPFGLTIKGKGKHVDAHYKLMDTIKDSLRIRLEKLNLQLLIKSRPTTS